MITLRIVGNPHPHKTHRCRCIGRSGRPYADPRNKPWRELVRDQANAQLPEMDSLQGPLWCLQEYILARPKSHFTSTGRIRKGAPIAPISKSTGDRDNYMKDTQDVLTELGLWLDDAQLTNGPIVKRYARSGEEPGVFIQVREDWETHKQHKA